MWWTNINHCLSLYSTGNIEIGRREWARNVSEKLELAQFKEQQGKRKKKEEENCTRKFMMAQIPRTKKECVVSVWPCTLEVDTKEAQRCLVQTFSCRVLVTGEDYNIIRGDFTDDIVDAIQEKWPEVDDESIENLGEVTKWFWKCAHI